MIGGCLAPLIVDTTANAHGDTPIGYTRNYRSEITDPGAPGLAWRILGFDRELALTNNTGTTVTVLGYQGEPYVRFVPGDGVYENSASPTTYLNRHRYGDAEIPIGVSASSEATWQRVADSNCHSWMDHRIHLMTRDDPSEVQIAPEQRHLIHTFEIPIVLENPLDTVTVAAIGQLSWLPDVAWWPPVLIMAAVFAAFVIVVAIATHPMGGRWIPLARTTIVLVLIVADAVVFWKIDELASASTAVDERVPQAVLSAVVLAGVVALCVKAWHGRPGGFVALMAASVILLWMFASGSASELSAPQFESLFPAWIRRWTIAATYVLAIPVFLAAAIAGRWYARQQPSRAPHDVVGHGRA